MRVTISAKYPYRVGRYIVAPGEGGDLVIDDEKEAKKYLSNPGVLARLARGVLRVSGAPQGVDIKGKLPNRPARRKRDAGALAASLGVRMRAADEAG